MANCFHAADRISSALSLSLFPSPISSLFFTTEQVNQCEICVAFQRPCPETSLTRVAHSATGRAATFEHSNDVIRSSCCNISSKDLLFSPVLNLQPCLEMLSIVVA